MQQAMFELIHSLVGLVSQRFEPAPHQQRASYVIALNTSFATLALLKPSKLLGFSVKLLNLPTQGAHLLSALCRALRQVVGHDPFRAVGGHLNPEQLHFEVPRKTFDLDQFALCQVSLTPLQLLDTPVRLLSCAIIYQPIALEWAVENLTCPGNLQHHLFGSVPCVHQHCLERELTVLWPRHRNHLPHMVQLALAISVRIEDAVVNHPELLSAGVDVHAGDQPYASDDTLLVATPLPTHHFDVRSEAMIEYSVIKDQVCLIIKDKLWVYLLPQQARRKLLSSQVAVDGIMAEALQMVGHVRQCVVDLAAQQKLAVVEFAKAHAFSLPSILPPLAAA